MVNTKLKQHSLVKNDQGHYCSVCEQQWKGKPRKPCPGAKLVKYNHNPTCIYKPQDHFISSNIKLLDLVCCYEKDKEYIYLYNPDGATENYFEDLPEVLDSWFNIDYQASISDCQYSYYKNIDGLRSLNLKPDDKTTSVACYWRSESREFVKLYNPYDCIILNPNLPTVYKYYSDLFEQCGEAFTTERLIQLNLKPKEKAIAVGAIWSRLRDRFDLYYLKLDCEINDPTLPKIYPRKPLNLFTEEEIKIFNKTPSDTPEGTFYDSYSNAHKHWFEYLYDPCMCENTTVFDAPIYVLITQLPSRQLDQGIGHANIPSCFQYIPDHLQSKFMWEVKEPLLELKKNSQARGYFWYKGEFLELYSREDLAYHDRDVLLSKTKLKQIYHISKSLFNKLGKPDQLAENPIDERFAPVKQYWRSRVEKFLKDNADAYAKHLARYNYYLEIFQANKDTMAAGRARKKAQKKALGKDGSRIMDKFHWDVKSEEVIEQTIKCLQCNCSMMTGQGFLCTVHAYGLSPDQFPCPDFTP